MSKQGAYSGGYRVEKKPDLQQEHGQQNSIVRQIPSYKVSVLRLIRDSHESVIKVESLLTSGLPVRPVISYI